MLPVVLSIIVLILSVEIKHSASAMMISPLETVEIPENTLNETELVTISVTGQIDPIICNIKSSTPNGPFTVWKKTGHTDYKVYYVVGSSIDKLNFNVAPKYELEIVCIDKDGENNTETLTVNVNKNKQPEALGLSSRQATVKTISAKDTHFQSINSIIYNLSVTDNENDVMTFTMYSDPDLGYFKIDPYNGQIKAAIDLRSAIVDTIPLLINVTDGTNTIGPLKVTIKLNDMNERPVFNNLPVNLTITEDATEGDVIIVLTFKDVDPFVQELEPICSVWPSSEKYKFTFEKNSNKIRLSTDTNEPQPLDYERTNFYNITCFIYDGYLYNEGDYINLVVLDVNEEPAFKEESYSCALYESDIGVSQCDLPLKVSDPDSDTMNIVLLAGNNSERFALVNNDKKLTFNINYDVDDNAMPTRVLLTAGVVDQHGLTGTTKIAITIIDRNDNIPEFTSSVTSYVITETQELGTLGTVTALDRDSGSNGDITYTVKGGSAAMGYVTMVGDGEFRYSGQYPKSMGGKSEMILVEAKDNGGDQRLSSTATVIVTFQPHSTTTTTTTTTTQPPIIITQAASSSSSSFSDNAASVGLLAALLSLLLLGLAGLAAYCLCCRAGGKFSGGQTNVQTGRKVHPDDYYRDSRYDRDYDPRDQDYDDRRGRYGDGYNGGREGSPYSTSQVQLLGKRDLPRIV